MYTARMSILQKLLLIAALLRNIELVQTNIQDVDLVTNFTVNMVKTQQVIIFACTRKDLLTTTAAMLQWNQVTQAVHLGTNYTLTSILTRKNHARTAVILDCACPHVAGLLEQVSALRYFNKTYQWLLWDTANVGVSAIFPKSLNYLGPNAQVTFVNGTADHGEYLLWDIHSKGLHLHSPMEYQLIAVWKSDVGQFIENINIFEAQGIKYRDQFNNLTLRGAVVIDRDNITTNKEILKVLAAPSKTKGVATFIKYHYILLTVLIERFNFTVNFRNSRGWAGRLGNTTFRLGLLGVVQRNEVDVAASCALNRINRFAEFDTIHQSWLFDTALLYRFTPELASHGKSGNFLAPFTDQVWCYAIATLLLTNFTWRLVEWLKNRWRLKMLVKKEKAEQKQQPRQHRKGSSRRSAVALDEDCESCKKGTTALDDIDGDDDDDDNGSDSENEIEDDNDNAANDNTNDDNEISLTGVSLKTFAAVCQQGMEPMPNGLSTRTIVVTMFLFSLVMYNFYTSSVVGGLLSSEAQGPATLADILESPLKLSFEDIGYYKVMFHETKLPLYKKIYREKVLPPRSAEQLPVFTVVADAIPFLKKGGYAFHCEVIDAYPHIARLFDEDEICDLRKVPGMMEKEVMSWIVPKQSQYTEIFRIVSDQMREFGLIKRTLDIIRSKKPPCQGVNRVYPISLSSVMSAFFMLMSGYIAAIIVLIYEIKFEKLAQKQMQTFWNFCLK